MADVWQKLKGDISSKRPFIINPIEVRLIEEDTEEWLNLIRKDTYNPSPAYIIEIPKGNGLIRPGSHLTLEDRVIYFTLLNEFLPYITAGVSWSQKKIDFANIISQKNGNNCLLENYFPGWDEFRIQSLTLLSKGFNYVVVTDISAFYENINIKTLISDLKELGVSDSVSLELLKKCLQKWSTTGDKGIPQGYSPSDILSKVYLNAFDYHLLNMKYVHLRYSDDIRVFCKNIIDAKKALIEVAAVLRKRGLNLQSAKTKILSKKNAKKEFEGQTEEVIVINKELPRLVYKLTGLGNPYMKTFDARSIVKDNGTIPIELVRETYRLNFISKRKSNFNSTLFHYLINLLADSKDKYAVSSCLSILSDRPEESEIILSYFDNTVSLSEVQKEIANFLQSQKAIYYYQIYLILMWLSKHEEEFVPELLDIAHRFTFDRKYPFFLRSVARSIIGSKGNIADLEKIESMYSQADNDLEKAEIICCLTKMESQKRNKFYSLVKDDGELQRRAVKLVKSKLSAAYITGKLAS